MPKTTKPKVASIPKKDAIDRTNPSHVSFVNEQKRMYSDASDYFVKETNETERALCAQLMLVDTVLLTGTLVAISNGDLFNLLTGTTKALIVIALLLLFISIGYGIAYYFAIIGYNKRWAIAKHKAALSFLDTNIKTWAAMRNTTHNLQADIPEELDQKMLKTQIFFIGAAAILYILALLGILFNFGNVLSSSGWIC